MSGTPRAPVVFLVDVDNTLLDNDRVTADLRRHLDEAVGPEGRARYWTLFEHLRAELGYADDLGALQRYRLEFPHDLRLLTVSGFLVDYPFASRLLPRSLDVLARFRHWGPLAVAMFCYQARKQVGAFAAAMGGVDTLVFTGGIWGAGGGCAVRVVPTREDLMIARHSRAILFARVREETR